MQENRVRRVAARRGYVAEKSRRRDPLATDYGHWTLTSASTGEVAITGPIDQVESFLTDGIRRR